MSKARIDLGEYPELSASLRGETHPETLYASCQRLLANCGVESTIDMLPATVTRWYAETELTGQPLYARVGRLHGRRGEGQLPIIVFDESPELPVETGNYLALAFQKFGNKISLVTQNSINPLIDDPRYLALAKDIIRDVAVEDVRERESAKDRWADRIGTVRLLGKKVYGYFMDNSTRFNGKEVIDVGKERRITWGLRAGAFMLAYGHLLGGDIDARLGPLPLPQPIELFVDLGNKDEHKAQGFKEPKGAVELAVGDRDKQLPVIDTYDTRGVPDATHTTTYGAPPNERKEYKEVSEPGLYEVNYKILSPMQNQGGDTAPPYCFTVYGNYRSGKSSVFTQDAATADNLRLEVRNTEELEACIVDGDGPEIKGSFYIWQDK